MKVITKLWNKLFKDKEPVIESKPIRPNRDYILQKREEIKQCAHPDRAVDSAPPPYDDGAHILVTCLKCGLQRVLEK